MSKVRTLILFIVVLFVFFLSVTPTTASDWSTPAYYAAERYLSGGWTYTKNIDRTSYTNGIYLAIRGTASKPVPITQITMRGYSFAAPPGRKIYKVEFDYVANYDTNLVAAGIDYPGNALHWVAQIGQHHQVVTVPDVDWVSFGLYVSKSHAGIPFEWGFRVENVKVYYHTITPPPPSLEGGTLRVSPRLGGAITYLELDGTNVIDTSDSGRLIQVDFGNGQETHNGISGGTPIYDSCRFGFESLRIKWNPTQASDSDACGPHFTSSQSVKYNGVNYPAYKHAAEINGTSTEILSHPFLDWLRNGVRSPFTLRQTTSKIATDPNKDAIVYSVKYELTNQSGYNYGLGISTDLPVLFLLSNRVSEYLMYNQNGTLQTWSCNSNPPPSGLIPANTSQRWAALKNGSRGVLIYYPNQPLQQGVVNFVFECAPGGATITNTMHLLLTNHRMGAYEKLRFCTYIATGNINDIRSILPSLPNCQ